MQFYDIKLSRYINKIKNMKKIRSLSFHDIFFNLIGVNHFTSLYHMHII